MDINWINIISGAIGGSIITLTVNQFIANRKEKKRKTIIIKTIIVILKDNYIKKYRQIVEDYENICNGIVNHSFSKNENLNLSIRNYILNDSEFKTLFSPQDLMSIFLKFKTINYNILNKIQGNLDTIVENSPAILAEEYAKKLSYKNNLSLHEIENIKNDCQEKFNHIKSFAEDNAEFYQSILDEIEKL